MKNKNLIIAYSGHAFVVCDIFKSNDQDIYGYFDRNEKSKNPYNLVYLGDENSDEATEYLNNNNWFVSIGDNKIRGSIISALMEKGINAPLTIRHFKSVISEKCDIGYGTMFAAGSIVNPLTSVGNGAICNTGSIIEHECTLGHFSHLGPGSVLCGNVRVGNYSFIGANSVIKPGITIGNNVTIGAGTVVLFDIPDDITVVGNPGRTIKK
ncbi:MAG: acetyltransferase [Saprospiraceae bacterium]|nr:acetyltransferase [Saprospiraceae bacterium]